jgi:ABC-type phosphate transport system substrate-binding protein
VSIITNTFSSNGTRRAATAALIVGQVLAAKSALAIDCNDPSLPSPIYGLGGSAQKPIIGKFAAGLAAASPAATVIYQAPGACLGINGLLGGTKLTGTASYWDTTGKELSCTIPSGGQDIDFAAMGNSATSCPGVASLPTDVGDFLGPVNTINLIVPVASSQLSISAEAAYFVFGFGQQGNAQPWVDDSQIFRRDSNSYAQLFVALASGVPVEKFKGVDTKTNAGTVNSVAQSPKPEAAIGLVSGELADANRATVRTLAYQHKGQRCGFLPDSTTTAFDKKNVRNGLYHIWAPLHFFAKVDGQKKIVKPEVAKYIGLFTGEAAAPASFNVLETEIKAGTVPKCAMNVWRESDLGDLKKYVPETPCGCYFDSVATGSTSCTACGTDDSKCTSPSAPKCRYGFCEAR